MMRSIAESIESSVALMGIAEGSDALACLELQDRLVGQPDLVEFAAMKHRHDDFQQRVVGDEGVGNGAGLAQVIRRDRIGIADRLDIHYPQAALDQHDLSPPDWMDKALTLSKVPLPETIILLRKKQNAPVRDM